MPFRFQQLEIPDVVLIEPQAVEDQRGFFMESYRHSAFATNGIRDIFVQDNYSHSVKGVLRGLHYQRHPRAQAKLVMVLTGEIFDVAVDIRRGSPTFGKWVSAILSGKNRRILYVPVGFAHGFCVLSGEADVAYKVTAEYAAEHEGGIIWNDPALSIRWPITDPFLSEKDARLPRLAEVDHGFLYEEVAR